MKVCHQILRLCLVLRKSDGKKVKRKKIKRKKIERKSFSFSCSDQRKNTRKKNDFPINFFSFVWNRKIHQEKKNPR